MSDRDVSKPVKHVQKTAWPRRSPKAVTRPGIFFATTVAAALMFSGLAAKAATTNSLWTTGAAADYSTSADWSPAVIPNGPGYYTTFGGTSGSEVCNVTAANDANITLYGMYVGTNSTGATCTVNMTGGNLWISNTSSQYILTVGGGFPGVATVTAAGAPGNGIFNMSGGNLTVARTSAATEHQDGFILGLNTNSTGSFSLSGGTATFLCGVEIGAEGAGSLSVSAGTLIANSWFHIGEGANSTTQPGLGSGSFYLSGGTVYVLPNTGGGPIAENSGFCLNNGVTNATAEISGGTLYCFNIGMNGQFPKTATNVLKITGGTFYIGAGGVSSNENVGASSLSEQITISGGTFHTADILVANAGGANGSTANVLGDGTNWTWSATLPVTLTNSAMSVNGTTGPGYVTFAPEATRTITLNNDWSGVGGMSFGGSGRVILAGANTYTGATTVNGGELSVSGSLASSKITVAGGAILDYSMLASAPTLASSVVVSNSSAGAMIGGNVNAGTATLALTYNGSTPSFSATNGTLTLSSGNVLNINNTGSALTAGTYTLIANTSAGTAGTVAGTIPASVTIGGAGLASKLSASLALDSGGLELVVVQPPPPPMSISSLSVSNTTLNISAINGSATSTFVVYKSTDVSLPLANWIPVVTNSFDVNGNATLHTNVLLKPLPRLFFY